jgi:DNA polymerase elongation subunit (family B)
MKYYTNVSIQGNNVLYRGVKNGRRVKEKIQYSPVLYLPSKKESEYKTLFGDNLEPRRFETIRDAKDFVKRFSEVENFKIYGNDRFEYAFIADEHKGVIDWDMSHLRIAVIDIEVGSENGFPDPDKAEEPITAITMIYLNGDSITFGCGDYKRQGDETYVKCADEYNLCKQFLFYWQENCPDFISGWNINGFDIPYIVNRFDRILGEEMTQKLSPWNKVWKRPIFIKGKEKNIYTILGVSIVDYIELYKWYAPGGKSQESYKLDNIANVELGENKLSFDEYDNLHQLYRLNYQKFIEYNIKDVRLVLKLEDKLKLIELALTLAYDTKTNFEDVFAQTRMWDSMIYSYLFEKNIIVPPKEIKKKSDAFEGAYVKDPQVGMHDWIASFDLNSLYPHLMMQYNISPETLIEPENYTDAMRDVIMSNVSVESLLHKKVDTSGLTDVTLTPNAQLFNTKNQGFLPKMLEEMYIDRKKYKKLMLKAKQEYENEKDAQKKVEIEKLVARYNNLQLAKKVSLNSAYGAMGSQYFRFYDLRMALAVTLAGQLSIRWIENKINAYMNKILKTNDEDYVIASDTDSIYLRLGDLVNKVYGVNGVVTMPGQKVIDFMDRVCEDKLQPYIDDSYQELADYVHAFQQKMQMKREVLANKGFWTAKKRYVLNVFNSEGVAYAEPEMKVMGLEIVKSSTPTIIRERMKETVRLIINTDESTVQDYIDDLRKEFRTFEIEDISFPRGVNGLKEYSNAVTLYKKGTPIHVRGAILYNHYIKERNLTNKYPLINDGEKLRFTYLKTPNPIKEDVISFPSRFPKDLNIEQYVDYETQFEKCYLEPMKTILEAIGWNFEKQNTLESFFS